MKNLAARAAVPHAVDPTLELARALIARRSLTPDDAGCQALIAARLAPLGFRCETLVSNGVTNWGAAWTRPACLLRRAYRRRAHGSHRRPVLDPFTPTERRAGSTARRGRAKSSLAAFVTAIRRLMPYTCARRVWWRCCSRPMRKAIGRRHRQVVEGSLPARRSTLPVGEPSWTASHGDQNGRRGTLSGTLTIKGVQGHVAYPQLARNPIHLAAPALAELAATRWDDGSEFFPPTTWQASNIHGGTGAANVIPGTLTVMFNFRYSTASTRESLQRRFAEILEKHGLDCEIAWTGWASLSDAARDLVDVVTDVVRESPA
jgi:succinyl-diaminopimelate desuccinylase